MDLSEEQQPLHMENKQAPEVEPEREVVEVLQEVKEVKEVQESATVIDTTQPSSDHEKPHEEE